MRPPGRVHILQARHTGLVSSALAMRHRPASLRGGPGLPPSVVERFGERGVKTTYAWQRGAIDSARWVQPGVLCADIGREELVAEVLLVKALMRRGRQGRALFVLPFTRSSTRRPKTSRRYLRPCTESREMAAARRGPRSRARPKARRSPPLGCPGQNDRGGDDHREGVGDDIAPGGGGQARRAVRGRGDESTRRGQDAEASSSRCSRSSVADRRGALRETGGGPQIVAMSATVRTVAGAARGWLDARLFITNYRPVELKEHVVNHGGEIFLKRARGKDDKENDGLGSETPDPSRDSSRRRNAVPLHLVRATEIKSEPTRQRERSRRRLLSEVVVPHLLPVAEEDEDPGGTARARVRNDRALTAPGAASARDGLARALAYAAEGRPDRDLVECRRGVAFHHAHLSKREKDLVEDAFRRGTLHTRMCTTTSRRGQPTARRVVVWRATMQFRATQIGSRRGERVAPESPTWGSRSSSRLGAKGRVTRSRRTPPPPPRSRPWYPAFPRFEASCYRPGMATTRSTRPSRASSSSASQRELFGP